MHNGCAWAVLIPIGVVFLGLALWQILRERIALRWTVVSGTITVSTVRRFYFRNGYAYEPSIEYEYHYNGKAFRSTRWSFGNFCSGGQSHAELITARYHAGSTVNVMVNPKDPAQAVLEYGWRGLKWALGLTGLIFVGGGVLSI